MCKQTYSSFSGRVTNEIKCHAIDERAYLHNGRQETIKNSVRITM